VTHLFGLKFLAAAALCLSGMTAVAQAPLQPEPKQSAETEVAAALPDSPGYVLYSSSVISSSANEEDQQQPQADPHAQNAGQKGHTESGEPQQTKRVLGIMPNFSAVSANEKLPPLSPKEKFILAGRNSFDYSSFILAGIQAGISIAGNSYPEFHKGMVGYGRYYWHTLADTADENFMVAGAFPIIFKQDPRFYTLGHGGFVKRASYAVSRILISRKDDGGAMPNYSEIIGAGAAAGVSSLYYPSEYRTWTKVGQKWLTSGLIDGANNLFKEYWPDINHKLFHTH
jgi:hypothetical protein